MLIYVKVKTKKKNMQDQIITIIITVLGIFLANAALIVPLFLWNRSEARADIRHMDAKLESTRELVRAIYDEMKDFHNRLCIIEERNKNAK